MICWKCGKYYVIGPLLAMNVCPTCWEERPRLPPPDDMNQYTEKQAFDWFLEENFGDRLSEFDNTDDMHAAFKCAWNWNK